MNKSEPFAACARGCIARYDFYNSFLLFRIAESLHRLVSSHAVHGIRRARSGNPAKQEMKLQPATLSTISSAFSFVRCNALVRRIEAICIG